MKQLYIKWKINRMLKSKDLSVRVEAHKLACSYAGMGIELINKGYIG